jgi:hypothetical protein
MERSAGCCVRRAGDSAGRYTRAPAQAGSEERRRISAKGTLGQQIQRTDAGAQGDLGRLQADREGRARRRSDAEDEASTPATANWNTPTLPGMIGKIPTSVEVGTQPPRPRCRAAASIERPPDTGDLRDPGQHPSSSASGTDGVAEKAGGAVQDRSGRPGQTRERGGELCSRA